MSSELERRLEGLLAAAPEPEPGAGEEALHRAVQALRPSAPVRRGPRTVVVACAAAAVMLAVAAGSLAAAGALHVSFGAKAKPRPARLQLSLPRGADGVAAIVNGRLSVVTKSGFRLQGLPVTAAGLSPHALFVAAGIGRSLVAMRPAGGRAWSHPSGGSVVAIAWAPDGLRIAYIVRTAHRLVLHVIWGNGTHDEVVNRSVRRVRPAWRANSLAFAYVGAGGKAIVYDLGHRSRRLVAVAPPATGVAFAPTGDAIAVARPDGVWLLHESAAGFVTGHVEAVGSFRNRRAIALGARPGFSRVQTFGSGGGRAEDFLVPGRVVSLSGGLVVTRAAGRLLAGWRDERIFTLLALRPRTRIEDVQIG